MKINKIITGLFVLILANSAAAQVHNWNSPSEVVKKIKKTYAEINSYTANFKINTVRNKKTKNMSGTSYYKNPGKIKYSFNNPAGDEIVSDGKTLWIYINRLGAVGKQDLTLDKKDSSGSIFQTSSAKGLDRLFRKYHYKFNSINQPQKDETDGKQYFVLALDQRVKIGGFEKMLLYVDSEEYLIRKTVAVDARGKETTIIFSNYNLNPELEDGIFNYHISGNAKIVNNPLVTE